VVNSYIWLGVPAAAAAIVAFALTPVAARLAVLVGAIDVPSRRKTHARPIPRLGGLAVVGAIATVWAASEWLFGVSLPHELSVGLIAGGLPILIVSVLDDMRGVSPGHKLLVHIAGASMAAANGVALGDVVHLFDVEIHIGVWALPLSSLWLIGITNAFNVIDGLDGLSAGLALIASLCMAAVFVLVGLPIMAGAALVLAGALAGFLPFNVHPARLFLGDSGATAIGFCLGAFALKGGSTLSSGFAALVPVFIMGLPIADTLIAIARRSIGRLEKRTGGVFVADRDHIHHRLLAHGVDHGRAVLILYAAGLVCAIAAFGSLFLQARHAALFIVAVVIAGAVGVRRLGYDEFAFIRRGTVLRIYESPVVNTSMFVVFADLAISGFAAYLALGLKTDAWALRETGQVLRDLVVLFAPLTALTFWYTGMYRGSWRLASVADLARAGGAAVAVTVAGAVVHPLLSPAPQPPSLFLIYGLVSVVMVAASRASYVVLRTSQRRASHPGIPVLVYGAGKHGIAASQELFENPATGLKPIGFVDDDPGKTGKLLSGLPVLGRSYELESLISAHNVKAIVIASPALTSDGHLRIVTASTRLGIGVFRVQVQFERILEEPAKRAQLEDAQTPVPVQSSSAGATLVAASPTVNPLPESEPCARCGGRNVHRSRVKGMYERFRKLHTPARPFRCDDCDWRGWLLPLEHAMSIDEIVESDLRSLDVAFSSLAPLGEGNRGSDGR
jgi:UDP-GlcNAc:undecaprenyl-phosphate GlcNAc-1-phosphate transferase